MLFFFFKQKTAYEMRISDWSSDVCSSDLINRVFKKFLYNRGRSFHYLSCCNLIYNTAVKYIYHNLLLLTKFRSEEHTSELQSTNAHLVCRLLLEKKKHIYNIKHNSIK